MNKPENILNMFTGDGSAHYRHPFIIPRLNQVAATNGHIYAMMPSVLIDIDQGYSKAFPQFLKMLKRQKSECRDVSGLGVSIAKMREAIIREKEAEAAEGEKAWIRIGSLCFDPQYLDIICTAGELLESGYLQLVRIGKRYEESQWGEIDYMYVFETKAVEMAILCVLDNDYRREIELEKINP